MSIWSRQKRSYEHKLALEGSGEAIEAACPSCGTKNRVPVEKLQDHPTCGQCKTALAFDDPVEVTDATFDGLVKNAPVPVLVDFWAPWCGPCRAVAPELEKVAREKQGELLVAKLNSDENPGVASRFGIRAIPTMVLVKKGREANRLVGAMNASQILSRITL